VAVQVKLTFKEALKSVRLETIVQNNSGSLPYLSPGKNIVTVAVGDPKSLGQNKLAVTYAYRLGSRRKSFEQLFDEDNELAKGHSATWQDDVICVQKTFSAGDLPTQFEIDCPTPKGKYPVYPRMLFVRREVLGPGQKPAATPAPPSTPSVGPDEELATLPSPWTIGSQPPPAMPVRPTRTTVLPPAKISYVSKNGEVFKHQFVKWLKDNSNAWILLVDFDTKKLPNIDDLAAARLVLYVEEAHDKAPMQAAAVLLDAPFEPDQPYDFSKLGQNLASTIIQKGTGTLQTPPRRYEIDVSRAIRAWARGTRPYGLAVRIVPNRGVDDGWTVRFTPAREKPVELEIATFADK
jgi:hypothetical protein